MNKVMLIGNVGLDPDVRYFEADQAVATVRLATTEKGYSLPNGTRVPDRTDWHNLVFYRRLAKVVEQYVHKGDKLYVDGRLQYRTYDDKKGMQRTATEIIVDNLELLTPRNTQQTVMPSPQQPMPASQQNTQTPQVSTSSAVPQQKDEEEVLPF